MNLWEYTNTNKTINVLTYTTMILEHFEKSWDDVEWCGVGEYVAQVNEFMILIDMAIDFHMPDKCQLCDNLVIVGVDWWLEWSCEQHIMSGMSEDWSFHTMPIKPKIPKRLTLSTLINHRTGD